MAAQSAPEARRNRLADENSPYLLQHADNPVHWYAWGQEAFEAARERGVPIFLSVGYSTCYWCHVMERESFENEAIASALNEHFVPIKVDREQHPHVDRVYMEAVQALTGRGGWPMSVFLTPPGARGEDDPGLEPFWGGTYFPPEPRMNMPGFPQVLEAMRGAWADRREDVLAQAKSVTDAIRNELERAPEPVRLGPQHVAMAANGLLGVFDETHGGFGQAPKFPQPPLLTFLLDARPYTQGEETSANIDKALRVTLDAMALGGVHDQVGGGFHRYSVDERWRVPHFEKMLYDNAQLAGVYAQAAVVFDDDFYRRVARETASYVLREMTSPEGLFFSAQDAEVDGREGRGYVWTQEMVESALEGEDLAFALRVYNMEGEPDFQDPHHPDEPAAHVPHLSARPAALAKELDLSREAFLDRLERVDAALLEARNAQERPGIDDKVIAGWNGLMIDGLARVALATGEDRCLDAALTAARQLLADFVDDAGALRRVGRGGRVGDEAMLEDYAYLTQGLLTARRVAMEMDPESDASWMLEAAQSLTATARSRFWDDEASAWFDTPRRLEDLPIRPRGVDDGVLPSAQSVMLHNLLTLHKVTGDEAYQPLAGRTLDSLSRPLAENPVRVVNATRALTRVMADHPGMFETFAFGSAPTLGERREEAAAAQPVQIFSTTSRVSVPAQGAGEITIQLRIAEGHHINAPEPGVEGLVGAKIEIENATGLEAVPQWPEPELYEGLAVDPSSDQRLMVYSGQVDIPVRIVRTGAFVAGNPRLRVTYQVCTETECLEPTSGALDVIIEAE